MAANIAITAARKDGSSFPVEISLSPIRMDGQAIVIANIQDITVRRNSVQALRQSQEDLRALAAHQERIKEEERKRIAREIHDELGAMLTGIKAYVSVAIDRAASMGIAPDPLLADASGLTDAAFETVRRVITDLRPSVLDQLGVWAALEWYAEQVTERTGMTCKCVIDDEIASLQLDSERSTMLFRIVQESLTNVVRHAKASLATIRVLRDAEVIVVTIEDNGIGIDAERLLNRESWGVVGMHERAQYCGCELKISGTPGRGTVVTLRLPLEQAYA
jgi:two-component system sensor histidine kinase UhpB